jgi:hypothetical protein
MSCCLKILLGTIDGEKSLRQVEMNVFDVENTSITFWQCWCSVHKVTGAALLMQWAAIAVYGRGSRPTKIPTASLVPEL